jgi:hypothetical protein
LRRKEKEGGGREREGGDREERVDEGGRVDSVLPLTPGHSLHVRIHLDCQTCSFHVGPQLVTTYETIQSGIRSTIIIDGCVFVHNIYQWEIVPKNRQAKDVNSSSEFFSIRHNYRAFAVSI